MIDNIDVMTMFMGIIFVIVYFGIATTVKVELFHHLGKRQLLSNTKKLCMRIVSLLWIITLPDMVIRWCITKFLEDE